MSRYNHNVTHNAFVYGVVSGGMAMFATLLIVFGFWPRIGALLPLSLTVGTVGLYVLERRVRAKCFPEENRNWVPGNGSGPWYEVGPTKGLPARCRAAALGDGDSFAEIVRIAGMYMTDVELSSLCTVSQSTVRRWKRGACEPHRLIKPRIYLQIANALEGSGK